MGTSARSLAVLLLTLCGALFLSCAASAAETRRPLTVDLAEKSVNITTGFTGAEISLFGMKGQPGDIAVVVQGPRRHMVVRYKSQVMGIWMNRTAVDFRNVPVYYDLALSRAERYLAAPEELRHLGIGLDALDFEASGAQSPEDADRFREALIRNKQVHGHFLLEPKNIVFLNDDFFRTDFYMPANVPTGEYTIKTFLFRDGRLAAREETRMRVGQVGFSARLYRFAHLHALAYGLVSVILAIVAGGSGWYFLSRE